MKNIETLVKELQEKIPLKKSINPGDIVIVAGLEPEFVLYALVRSIERDPAKHDEWWHLSMTLLSVPPRDVVWTLRSLQMTGAESFTMEGRPRYVAVVDLEKNLPRPAPDAATKRKGRPHLRLVK